MLILIIFDAQSFLGFSIAPTQKANKNKTSDHKKSFSTASTFIERDY